MNVQLFALVDAGISDAARDIDPKAANTCTGLEGSLPVQIHNDDSEIAMTLAALDQTTDLDFNSQVAKVSSEDCPGVFHFDTQTYSQDPKLGQHGLAKDLQYEPHALFKVWSKISSGSYAGTGTPNSDNVTLAKADLRTSCIVKMGELLEALKCKQTLTYKIQASDCGSMKYVLQISQANPQEPICEHSLSTAKCLAVEATHDINSDWMLLKQDYQRRKTAMAARVASSQQSQKSSFFSHMSGNSSEVHDERLALADVWKNIQFGTPLGLFAVPNQEKEDFMTALSTKSSSDPDVWDSRVLSEVADVSLKVNEGLIISRVLSHLTQTMAWYCEQNDVNLHNPSAIVKSMSSNMRNKSKRRETLQYMHTAIMHDNTSNCDYMFDSTVEAVSSSFSKDKNNNLTMCNKLQLSPKGEKHLIMGFDTAVSQTYRKSMLETEAQKALHAGDDRKYAQCMRMLCGQLGVQRPNDCEDLAHLTNTEVRYIQKSCSADFRTKAQKIIKHGSLAPDLAARTGGITGCRMHPGLAPYLDALHTTFQLIQRELNTVDDEGEYHTGAMCIFATAANVQSATQHKDEKNIPQTHEESFKQFMTGLGVNCNQFSSEQNKKDTQINSAIDNSPVSLAGHCIHALFKCRPVSTNASGVSDHKLCTKIHVQESTASIDVKSDLPKIGDFTHVSTNNTGQVCEVAKNISSTTAHNMIVSERARLIEQTTNCVCKPVGQLNLQSNDCFYRNYMTCGDYHFVTGSQKTIMTPGIDQRTLHDKKNEVGQQVILLKGHMSQEARSALSRIVLATTRADYVHNVESPLMSVCPPHFYALHSTEQNDSLNTPYNFSVIVRGPLHLEALDSQAWPECELQERKKFAEFVQASAVRSISSSNFQLFFQ